MSQGATIPVAKAPHAPAQTPWAIRDYAWITTLAVVALLATAFLWVANRPGRMTLDSAHQLKQVLGEIPLDDWHPAIMTVTWTGLFRLTGEISSMVLVQLALTFIAALLFAIYLHDLTRKRSISVLAIIVPLLPYVVTFLGVLWKDAQMMIAFLLGTVLILLAERFPKWRYPLLLLALGFLLYGTLVRKNAFFAILPLVFLLYRVWRDGSPLRHKLTSERRRTIAGYAAATAVFLLLLLTASTSFNAVFQPKSTNQLSQVFLDDIVFTVPAQDIEASTAPRELKDKLLQAQAKCEADNVIWDAYWKCYGRGATGQAYEAIAHESEVQNLWLQEVVTHPDRYLFYRIQTYARFLFVSDAEYSSAERGHLLLPVKYHVADTKADSVLTDYVVEFGVKTFPWLFKAWFWMTASIAIIVLGRKATRFGPQILALGASGFLYLAGYFPIVPASNYRYSYWAAVACTVAAVLLVADRHWRKQARISSQSTESRSRNQGL